MNISCEFKFKYPDATTAAKVRSSLEVDNSRFVKTKLDNETLVAEMEADSIMSLLHTIEDYIACLSIAENVLEQVGQKQDG
jgi:hypothetical protein